MSKQKHLVAAATALRELAESGELGDAFASVLRESCLQIVERADWPIEGRWLQLRELQRLARIYQRGGAEALTAAMVR